MKIEIGQVYKTNEGGSATVINYIHAEKVLVQHNDDYKHGHCADCEVQAVQGAAQATNTD